MTLRERVAREIADDCARCWRYLTSEDKWMYRRAAAHVIAIIDEEREKEKKA
jgi:hypothetical protein